MSESKRSHAKLINELRFTHNFVLNALKQVLAEGIGSGRGHGGEYSVFVLENYIFLVLTE